jgi:hypothetical protein
LETVENVEYKIVDFRVIKRSEVSILSISMSVTG